MPLCYIRVHILTFVFLLTVFCIYFFHTFNCACMDVKLSTPLNLVSLKSPKCPLSRATEVISVLCSMWERFMLKKSPLQRTNLHYWNSGRYGRIIIGFQCGFKKESHTLLLYIHILLLR